MNVSRLWSPVTRWGEFRRRQLAALEESNRIAARSRTTTPDAPGVDPAGPARRLTSAVPAARRAGAAPAAAPRRHRRPRRRAGAAAAARPGPPTASSGGRSTGTRPFYIGFFGATGALLAIGLWSLVGRLTTTLTLLVVSLFLALALNPLVDALVARGVRRSAAGRGGVRRAARRLRR